MEVEGVAKMVMRMAMMLLSTKVRRVGRGSQKVIKMVRLVALWDLQLA